MQVSDALGFRFVGVLESNIENGLCNGELMHSGDYSIENY
jgi:hypothetical protein